MVRDEKVGTKRNSGATLLGMAEMKRKPKMSKPKGGQVSGSLERHYGIREASERLGIPASTLRHYVRLRYVSVVKFPGRRGRILLAESALVDLVSRFREPARYEIEEELHRMERGLPSRRRKVTKTERSCRTDKEERDSA